MKTYIRLLFAAFVGLFLATFAFAQDPTAPVSIPPDAQNFILNFFVTLAASHPWVATVITVLGSMRLWAKPLFGFVHSVIEMTPTKTDDGFWAAAYDFFTVNPLGKTLAWLLDFVGSIKIVPPAPPVKTDS